MTTDRQVARAEAGAPAAAASSATGSSGVREPAALIGGGAPAPARSHDLFGADYLHFYRPILTPERTAREVDFLQRVLGLCPEDRVLDLCCGHGRHAIALAARGYRVTGVDLSAPAVALARRAARAAGVADRIRFVRGDMRRPPVADGPYHAVVNLFSSFGYFDDAANAELLRRLFAALRPGGRLLLDLRNREHWVRHPHPVHCREIGSDLFVDFSEFDPLVGRLAVRRLFVRAGRRREVRLSFRLYAYTELRDLLAAIGFSDLQVWGGFGEPYSCDAERMIVAARRPLSAPRADAARSAPPPARRRARAVLTHPDSRG
ncbi:MAG: methyltransferase domain-containing protein [Planctomycetes bacterium]|nr:methyltransferase domain-containing protein [Planctomycetota bacterium]